MLTVIIMLRKTNNYDRSWFVKTILFLVIHQHNHLEKFILIIMLIKYLYSIFQEAINTVTIVDLKYVNYLDVA